MASKAISIRDENGFIEESFRIFRSVLTWKHVQTKKDSEDGKNKYGSPGSFVPHHPFKQNTFNIKALGL